MQPMPPVSPANVRWEWIGAAWDLFRKDALTWVLMGLIILGLVAILFFPVILLFGGIGALMSAGRNPEVLLGSIGALALLLPLLLIIGLLGGAYLGAGLFRTALKAARGEAIALRDLFSGGDVFLPVLGYFLLLVVVQIVIGIITGIPGAIIEELDAVFSIISSLLSFAVSGLLLFALPQVVDRRARLFEAISNSLKITLPHVLMYTLFALVTQMLTGIGVLACGVGLLVTLPFAVTIPAVAYRDVFGLRGAHSYDQFVPPPPPDYRRPEHSYIPAAPAPLTEPIQESTTSICPHCGATLTRAANFCNQCGRPLRQP